MIQCVTATDDVPYGSTRGCSSACQRECIEVINKYRLNHNALGVKFSQLLANKAQKWADGGNFGYDMKSRGKYGQLIEWDVKDELQNFTNVIKHWHDKERDFDFASGRSKTGKTLHDFTQIVWKKARKAGCGQSEIFGSKYYVVWMDSDGVLSPNMEANEASVGSPQQNDLHWFERGKQSAERKPTYVVPLRPQDADSTTRGLVEPELPINTARGGGEQGKPRAGHPDLNEVREEHKVLNNNALLKQYLFNDTLNNVVLNENKETASYHVVSGAEDSANWQKGAESLIQLGNDRVKTNQTSPNHGLTSPDRGMTSSTNSMMSPVGDGEEDDSKQAARFQSLVIQDDDMLTKDEGDANGTVSTEASDSDDIAEGDDYQQAAIQSMMKQEDDMIQNEEPADDDELSGGSPPPSKATSEASNNAAPGNSNHKSSSKPIAKSNEAFVINITEVHRGEEGKSFYTSGVALNNNPNETNSSTASNDIPVFELSEGKANSSLHDAEINNQSTTSIQPGTTPDSLSKESHGTEENEDRTKGGMQISEDSLLKNDKAMNKMVANTPQSAILCSDSLSNQEKITQQPKSKESAPTDLVTSSSNSSNDMEQVASVAPSPKVSSSQGKIVPGEIQSEKIPFSSKMQPQLTLTEMITPGAKMNPNRNSPSISQVQNTPGPLQQTGTALGSHHPTSSALGSQKTEQSVLISGIEPHNGQSTESNAVIQLPIANGLDASSHDSDLHLVTSPALITLPNSSSRPIKLVFHFPDMKSKGESSNTPLSGSQGGDDNQSTSMLNAAADMMKNDGLPSVIKESENHKKAQSVAQDEPCQDMPKYQFSCPRWQARGYCEKKENEMKTVCRRTCGFCVADPVKARHQSMAFQHSPLKTNTGITNTGNVKAPKLSKPPASIPTEKTNENNIFNDQPHLKPQFDDQTINITPLKAKVSLTSLPEKTDDSNILNDQPHLPPQFDAQTINITPLKAKVSLASLSEKTNGNNVLNDRPHLTPHFDMQTINITPMKARISLTSLPAKFDKNNKLNDQPKLKQQFDMQNVEVTPLRPKISLIKVFEPFVGVLTKSNTTNTTETPKTSSHSPQDKHLSKETESLPFKNQDDQISSVGSNNTQNSTLKLVGQPLIQRNRTSLLDQSGLKITSSLPRGQGVPSNLNKFIKRPIKIGLSYLNGTEIQSSLYPAGGRVISQNYRSKGEDNLIMEGIQALQHKLQAPVQISAVAKSNSACGQRLCKEKVKTQQAKTRETIGDQALADVTTAHKTEENPVSTTGCNSSCQQECLAAHNRYRLNHGASPLILDQTLANQAQQWADKKVFKHSPWAGGQGGETIALGSLYPSFTAAVKAWHDEEKDYDWSTGKAIGDMKVNHFTQVVWKGAHLLGCGKTIVNGEPYYIAQMDIPGVIAGVPGYDKSNVGEPKEPDLKWFMDSSPYWKEMQTKDAIPKNIEHRIL
ncbi:Pathogenesis-related leaf protein 4 [Stylophora pistillata]|uniref:Pathogenesis-related leaf protein 4 n=1 Tax=Stylophora pistillata TaxID=50429 RepID=A0A2B4SIN1_STYPI|nr:Pathogenesis-related leaf protein 4 [Stylophora pistillata]